MSVTELTVSSNIEVNGRKVQIVARLGQGAVGTSYLVRYDDGTDQVLKVFDTRYGEIFKQRLHQFKESRFTSSDSVVGYVGAGFFKDQPYVLHEYVQAKSFDEIAKASKFDPKRPQASIDTGVKLCQAVAAIHGYELIHGHLWNGNVFFNVYGDPVLVDPFIGAPTPADVSSGLASASQLSLYLAPEQKDINGFLDPRTDVWHIGALLCRLYTGKPDLAVNELCLRELYKAKVPLSLIRVLWQSIQKSWHSRYADVTTFEVALREAFEPEHRKTVYVKPLPYAPGTKDGWSRQLSRFTLGAAAAGLTVAGIWLLSPSKHDYTVKSVAKTNTNHFAQTTNLDLKTTLTLEKVAQLDAGNRTFDVFVKGSIAYLATMEKGLVVVDISNISNPRIVARFDTPELCVKIAGRDNTLISVDAREFSKPGTMSSLTIYDITIPSRPRKVGLYKTSQIIMNVDIEGANLYASTTSYKDGSESGFIVVNISNPAIPTEIARVETNAIPASRMVYGTDIIVEGNTAVLADAGNGVILYDVTIPNTPREVQRIKHRGNPRELEIENGKLYVSGFEEGILTLTLDPTKPNRYSDSRFISLNGYALLPRHNKLFYSRGGLINGSDVSRLGFPVHQAFASIEDTAVAMALEGECIFVANRNAGLAILRIIETEL